MFLATVDGGRSSSTYRKDAVIFPRRRGGLGFLRSGLARQRRLIGQPLRLASARAMSESVACGEKAEMVRVLHAEPTFAEVFTAYLLLRKSRVEEDLVDQLFNSSEKRLARMLLLLANFGKEGREGRPEPIAAKISQETLAEMIGSTRTRVNLFMNKFRRQGFIDYSNGTLRVHSSIIGGVLHE
jgi:CRP-like cAMP-binding protein